ncbi:MAG: carotenoid oxygenase family protein [Candidatus Latescibacteria bacterium]|nr:carotenoid oxygenase family protein [Candidatus Latescibacterota bacterium]
MDGHAPFLERVFSLDVREGSYVLEGIEGEIPDYVRGNYYLNGPARFVQGDLKYRHWLDGDGMVCSLQFGEKDVHLTNRYVRSRKFVDEAEAGQALYRTFGTAFDDDALIRGIALASPVNVSVYPFAGKLLAFGEQGLPYELDLVSLETLGEYTFGKRLNAISPFSAHPKFDSESGELFNFGIAFSSTQPMLNVYRFDAQANFIYRKRHALNSPCSIHDFALSKNYAVFYLSPYILDMGKLMGEGCTLMDALEWMPERGSRLLVLSRETGDEVATVEIGENYCLHLTQAFEDNDALILDVIELTEPVYDQYQVIPDLFSDVREARSVRLTVDVAKQSVRCRNELSYRMMCDFPAIDPRKTTQRCDDFWVLGISQSRKPGRKFLDQLVHLNWNDTHDIYQAPANHYLGGEPVFVGGPEEKDGAIICQMLDAENLKSFFVIFDAFDVAKGPVATLPLHSPIHLGFHACFEIT